MNESRRTVLQATAGVVGALGAAGTATAQDGGEMRPDWGGWLDGIDGGYEDLRGESEVTVQVGAQGNGGAFAFAPAGVWVDPGTTVRWEWTGEGGGHNVVAEEGPAGLDSGDPVIEAGVNYEYTFEEGDAGITTYFCDPHRSLGMLGAVAVGDDVPTVQAGGESGDGGDGGDAVWQPPGSDVTVALVGMAFGAVALGVLSVLGAEWYAGHQERKQAIETAEEAPAELPTEEAPAEEPAVEISHDEFNPVGTATLVALYFVILVLMWVFVYFVEFLGNGPMVIG